MRRCRTARSISEGVRGQWGRSRRCAHLEVEDDVGVVGELEGKDEPDCALVSMHNEFEAKSYSQPENWETSVMMLPL
jgi:hypothetical protein